MRSPDRGSVVWPLQTALLVLAALYALWFHLTLPGKLPAEEDYAQVARHLGEHARDGDAVLLFPWWAERARLFVPRNVPVVGYVGSDADPLLRHPRVWVLAQPRLPRAKTGQFEAAFLPQRRKLGETMQFGTLELTLYENGRHRRPLWSAGEAVARGAGRVYLERADGRRSDCTRAGDGWRCPGGGHLYVRTEWHEVFYEPRRCVYAHAPGGDVKLTMEFEDVPAHADELLLEAGIIWEHAVKRQGITPTFVRLDRAGAAQPLIELELPPGVEGFQRGRFEDLNGSSVTGPLRVTVQSQNADSRQVCLDLSAFGERTGDGDAAAAGAPK